MSWTIKQALQEAASLFRAAGIEAPRSEAEYLLCFVLRRERAYLYSHGDNILTEEQRGRFQGLADRRSGKVPLAYITGEKEFMGKTFRVNPHVLIPRPETEHLVEAVIHWLKSAYPKAQEGQGLNMLDLGTGCGNIAIMLALHFPAAAVTAVDISQEAVKMARKNIRFHGVERRVHVFCGGYWDFFAPDRHRFHVIVSNPPYIPESGMDSLMAEVQKEPPLALAGGPDGLAAYRQILPGVRNHLVSPGLAALEIGEGQAGAVKALGQAAGLSVKDVIQDYGNRERVICFEVQVV